MPNFQFQKATKERSFLRLALIGPSGSGKTYTALNIATNLDVGKVALIDTERGSASKYADLFDFDTLDLDSFEPLTYVDAINAAVKAGYGVVVVDSLSHAWMGKGGALEQVDRFAKRERGNSFGAWREVTPMHNALVDSIIGASAHVIATMRAKTEYVQEKDERGKTVVRKVGLAPVQRDGLEYEFDVVGDMDADNNLIVTKTRLPKLAGAVIARPNGELSTILKDWLRSGVEPTGRNTAHINRGEDSGNHDTPASGGADHDSSGGGAGMDGPLATVEERQRVQAALDQLDPEMKSLLADEWKATRLPSFRAAERFTGAHAARMIASAEKVRRAVFDDRRRHVMARLTEVYGRDVVADDVRRHLIVKEAVGSGEGSTKALSAAELTAILEFCDQAAADAQQTDDAAQPQEARA